MLNVITVDAVFFYNNCDVLIIADMVKAVTGKINDNDVTKITIIWVYYPK